MIRPATDDDIARLQDIETAAGQAFRTAGMDRVADDEPPSHADLAGYVAAGNAWVDIAADGTTAGYLVAFDVDSGLHIEQVSVDPAFAGRGIGAQLIEHLADTARSRGRTQLTLTTFRDVPWNRPYYARLGFVDVADPSPALRAIRAHETELGLDTWPRVVMVRPIQPCPAAHVVPTPQRVQP